MDSSRRTFRIASDRSRDPKELKKFPNVRECVIRFGAGTPLGGWGGRSAVWWGGGFLVVGSAGRRSGRCHRRRSGASGWRGCGDVMILELSVVVVGWP